MSQQRRLLIVSRSLPFHVAGGMEHVAWDLARTLAERGVAVTVLTTSVPGRAAAFSQDGVRVVAAPGTTPGRYSRPFRRASRSWFRRNGDGVDSVLSVSAGAYGLLGERSSHPGVRFVMQAHGTSVGEIQARWRGPGLRRRIATVRNASWLARDLRAYGNFDRVVAVGPRVEAQLRGWPLRTFVPSDRVIRIDNGIDTGLFRPDAGLRAAARRRLGWGPDDRVVVTVSRLHALKGVREAMRGFATFASARAGTTRLLIVGDGPERRALEAEAARALAPGSFHFSGEARRPEVAGLLNAADVFLFPVLRAEVGLPLNVLEAAATGLPLVLSDALRGDVAAPLEATCVAPRDADAMAAALARAAESPASRDPASRASALPDGRSLGEVAARYEALLFPEPGS